MSDDAAPTQRAASHQVEDIGWFQLVDYSSDYPIHVSIHVDEGGMRSGFTIGVDSVEQSDIAEYLVLKKGEKSTLVVPKSLVVSWTTGRD